MNEHFQIISSPLHYLYLVLYILLQLNQPLFGLFDMLSKLMKIGLIELAAFLFKGSFELFLSLQHLLLLNHHRFFFCCNNILLFVELIEPKLQFLLSLTYFIYTISDPFNYLFILPIQFAHFYLYLDLYVYLYNILLNADFFD